MKTSAKKWLSTLTGLALAAGLLAGCGEADTPSPEAVPPAESTAPVQAESAAPAGEVTTVSGLVTAVEGDQVTMELVMLQPENIEMPESMPDSMPERPEDASPEAKDASPEAKDAGPRTEDADGDDIDNYKKPNSEAPAGELPAMGNGPGYEPLGETRIITVSGDTAYTIQGSEGAASGTIDDLVLGSLVTVTLSGDVATEVFITPITPVLPEDKPWPEDMSLPDDMSRPEYGGNERNARNDSPAA